MATIRILLGIVWFAALGSGWSVDRDFVEHSVINRGVVVAIAQKEIGVREAKGNTGLRVNEYNAYVGLKNVAWCASFISWCFGQAGYSQPRTAWSPALFPANRLVKDPLPGRVLGIYFPELKRIAHCGIVEKVKNELVYSVEGNTNVNGSREGDGVYRRIRHKRSIYKFSDWSSL